MKFKQLSAILKKSKSIYLYRGNDGCQWIGDGSAVYPMYGMPRLERENIFDLFDIPVKKRDEYRFYDSKIPTGMNWTDVDTDEFILDVEKISVSFHGVDFCILQSKTGMMLINSKYLDPVSDSEGYEFYCRRYLAGRHYAYIAIKKGISLIGIVSQINVTPDFAETLRELASSAYLAIAIEKRETADQMGLNIEESDEEYGGEGE